MKTSNRHIRRARRVLTSLAVTLGISASLAALSTSPALSGAQVGTSAAVRGQVFVRAGTEGLQRRAAVSQSIHLQDQILTKQESAIQILLLDQSVFTVGENCRLVVDRFVYDPDRGVGEMTASVLKGAFRFMSGKIGGNDPTAATVKTPSATLGIRGTFLEAVVGQDAVDLADKAGLEYSQNCDPSKAGFYILRGPGRNTNSLEDTGMIDVDSGSGTATISQANYAVFVPCPGAEPIGPFPVPDSVLQYLDFFLRSAPTGPGVNPVDINVPGSEFTGQSLFNNTLNTSPPNPPQGLFDTNIPQDHTPPVFES